MHGAPFVVDAATFARGAAGFAAMDPPGFAWLDGAWLDPAWTGAVARAGAAADARLEGIADGGARGVITAWPVAELVGDGPAVFAALDGARGAAGLRDVAAADADDVALWIGACEYDAAAHALVAGAIDVPRGAGPRPGAWLRGYGAALLVEPCAGGEVRVWPWGERDAAARLCAAWQAGVARAPAPAWGFGPLVAPLAPADYRARVAAALEHIRAGDLYQVNLSQGFAAPWAAAGEGADAANRASAVAAAYLELRARAPAPLGALLRGAVTADAGPGAAAREGSWVLSNSPETLIEVDVASGRAVTWPIKGTRRRGNDSTTDAALIAELRASTKELAEHVMIVDLLRNDLGRLADPGSVRAPAVPQLITLPTVHHLVTPVAATLRPGWGWGELFRALLPGGSITGAPKRRAVQCIAALEREPRGLYCGAIVAGTAAGLRASIPIRTAEVDAAGLHVRSGGGVVHDSDPEAERLETLVKVRAFAVGGLVGPGAAGFRGT